MFLAASKDARHTGRRQVESGRQSEGKGQGHHQQKHQNKPHSSRYQKNRKPRDNDDGDADDNDKADGVVADIIVLLNVCSISFINQFSRCINYSNYVVVLLLLFLFYFFYKRLFHVFSLYDCNLQYFYT